MDSKPELTVIALGLIFAGIIVMFTAFYHPSVTVRRPDADSQTTAATASDTDSQPTADAATYSASETAADPAADETEQDKISYPIDLNTATANELADGIPGIGDVLASRIVEYRELYGPYSSVDDLLIISGINQNKLDSIRQYLTV